jgi:riboflavin synthase
MFTGLIEDVGVVQRIAPGGITELWVRTSLAGSGFALGSSISVDGVCLTVAERSADAFRVQASPETLRRSTLGSLERGSEVNLERALKIGDRLGGHLVLGHADAVAQILSRRPEGGSVVMDFSLPQQLAAFFIEKGSVAVDGVSLTVNELGGDRFSVSLIPETQKRTALARKSVGARVNLEADVIGKYLARLYGLRKSPDLNNFEESLRRAGFISEA